MKKIGPPFTHLSIPSHSRYIGSNSSKQDPDGYIKSIYELFEIYKKEYSHLELIVNTSGWIRGPGLDILGHVLQIIQPTNILKMESLQSGPLDISSLTVNLASQVFTLSHNDDPSSPLSRYYF